MILLGHENMKKYVSHEENITFQKAINPGTIEDFDKEMNEFYPSTTVQYERLRD